MERGPAANLRKTPGRIANKRLTKTELSVHLSPDEVSELEQVGLTETLDGQLKSGRRLKGRTRRPTGKQPISANISPCASQVFMNNFLKRNLIPVESEGYDTEPEVTSQNIEVRSRRNSESDITKIIKSRSVVSSSTKLNDTDTDTISMNSLDKDYLSVSSAISVNDTGDQSTVKAMRTGLGVFEHCTSTMEQAQQAEQNCARQEVLNTKCKQYMQENSSMNNEGQIQIQDGEDLNSTVDCNRETENHGQHKQTVARINNAVDQCIVTDCNYATGQVFHQHVYVHSDNDKRKQLNTTGVYKGVGMTAPTTTVTVATSSTTYVQPSFASKDQLRTQTINTTSSTEWDKYYHTYYRPSSEGNTMNKQAIDTAPEEQTVFGMFSAISRQIAGLSGELATIKQQVGTLDSKFDGLNFDLQGQQQLLQQTAIHQNHCADQIELLAHTA